MRCHPPGATVTVDTPNLSEVTIYRTFTRGSTAVLLVAGTPSSHPRPGGLRVDAHQLAARAVSRVHVHLPVADARDADQPAEGHERRGDGQAQVEAVQRRLFRGAAERVRLS
jgi:hypothetical protein